jgi:heat shock protein HtpX
MFNYFKTALLMASIMALFGVVGMMLGGRKGMALALIFGGGMNFVSYWFSDRIVLKMYRARQVDAQSAPQFYNMIEELARNV